MKKERERERERGEKERKKERERERKGERKKDAYTNYISFLMIMAACQQVQKQRGKVMGIKREGKRESGTGKNKERKVIKNKRKRRGKTR